MNRVLIFYISLGIFAPYLNLGLLCFLDATKGKITRDLLKYMGEFREAFCKHCRSETEINIKGNNIDDEGWGKIAKLRKESEVLDIEANLHRILDSWLLALDGQPQPYRDVTISSMIRNDIADKFYNLVHDLQEGILKEKKKNENLECLEKCSEGPKIFNFTNHVLDPKIAEQLRNGLGYVPHSKYSRKDVIDRIETEIKEAAIRYFKRINGFRPPYEISNLPMGQFITNILIFSTASHDENEFFYGLTENFNAAIKSLNIEINDNYKIDDLSVFNNLPEDTIISNADKNIGIALLPIQWFIEEYQRQQIKGGFETIEITEKQCLANLELYISKFWDLCSNEQRAILKPVWPKNKGAKKIGIMKILPKVHKLKDEITNVSWKSLTGRPIRGAEQCPTNAPSIALCKLIQQMLGDIKQCYQSLAPNSILARLPFPLIKGCDSYSDAINNINLLTSSFSSTFILSADFSDAYTLSIRKRLQESLNYLGQMLDYQTEHISLIMGLVDLVFDNVFFFSIFGLQRSTRGYPMGGHASRDALDIDLLRSELELLAGITLQCSTIHYFGRMVDDISIIMQGSFDDMIKILISMATIYPDMPLNVQISQNYSKFLDMNLYNFRPNGESKSYKLTTTLSWKKQNSYNYINESDNKCPIYKGAVVPVTMTRINRRCTRFDEKQHHSAFIFRILESRGQCPNRIALKREKFIKRLKGKGARALQKPEIVFTTVFDGVSKSHEITKRIISKSARFKISVIHKSLSSSAARICPKRKILKKITKFYHNSM